MNNMAELDNIILQRIEGELGGVFKLSDLQIALQSNNQATLHNRINRLEKYGFLSRFSKGVYISKTFSSEVLSTRICSESYISMGNVLARNGLIGTVPGKRIRAVKVGRNRRYQNNDLIIEHFGITERLYFGYNEINGIKFADNEKAFLDTLYYHMRGYKFSFNPDSDIDLDQLSAARLKQYLTKYKNKKFVKFCQRVFNG